MKCPLCEDNTQKPTLFTAKNILTSSGKISKHAFNSGGGGGSPKQNLKYCKGDETITLVQCQNCGYVFNSTFNLEAISKEYQSDGYYSRKIVSKAMGGAIKIIKDKICNYINKDSVCLEIAPGSGDMLNALIQDVKFYYTVDPSLVSLEIEEATNLQHIQGFFNYQEIKDKIKHKVDFILFRHLLEHINTPLSFLKEVASLLHDDGVAYIEVPNFGEIVDHNRFYEIFNDHCGYYQENVLINAMSKLGFELTETIMLFREQHMGLFFKKSSNCKNSCSLDFKRFDKTLEKKFNKTKNYLESLLESYKEIAIYGAGAHGNSLANYLENPKNIKKCFDLDTRKQGKYLQNSDILIQEPNEANFDNIECIIIASPLYEKEIINSLRQKGFTGDVIATEKEIRLA